MIKNRLVLIDAYALIFRAYHSIPPHFTDRQGRPTNAVYGFTSALLSAIKELRPEYLAVGIDMGKSHRIKDYEHYKIHRPPAPDDFKIQVPIVREILEAMNIPVLGVEGYEGEDVIATIVAQVKSQKSKVKSEGIETIIVTGDMDLLQLIDGASAVYSMARGTQQAVIYDEEKVKERYGIRPDQFVDYKALKGDASDNIPGVKGIGEKTATDLIHRFESLENLYNVILNLSEESQRDSSVALLLQDNILKKASKELKISEKVLRLLIENKEQAFLSQKLSKIVDDAPIDFELNDARVHDYDRAKVTKILKELGFKSLILRLPLVIKNEDKQQSLF